MHICSRYALRVTGGKRLLNAYAQVSNIITYFYESTIEKATGIICQIKLLNNLLDERECNIFWRIIM
ncbi:MAG: hypothetical protein ABRQ38_30500 [Candidatus Eremiobacterota bacterium]